MTFSGGSFTLASGAVFSGPGFVGVANGGPSFSGTLGSALQWSGGNLGGNWSIATSGSLTLSGGATKYLDGAITNAGTITFASGLAFDANNAQIINQASGLVDVQGDYAIYPTGGYSGMQIINTGTFRKSGGSGSLTLQIPLVNSGQLAIQSGALNLSTTLTLNAAGTVNGAVIVNDVAINGTLHGSLTWLSGELYGQLFVANDGVLSLTGSLTKYLDGTLTNAGTINLGSVLAYNGPNAQVVNQAGALVDVQGDYGIFPTGGWPGLQFVNAGTFRKSAGTNNATVSGISFLSTGQVESQRGLLSFATAFSNAAGSLAVRLNGVADWGRIAWTGPLALNGPFNVSLLSGYTPALSNTFQVFTYPSVTGSFTSYSGLELGGGLKLTPELGPTAFSLTVEGSSVSRPTILTQPASQTVTTGTNVTFSVTASGTPPLSYLWQFNGANLANATNATLTLTNVQLGQGGNYSVLVSNAAGFILSSNALLTVSPAPSNCVPVPAGLLSWWSGNGSAADSVGTNNGIVMSGAAFAPGEVEEAFSFDGVSGWVDIPNPALLNPAGPFSIEAWIKANPQQLTAGGIFLIVDKSHGFTDGTGWVLQGNADGTVGFAYGIGGSSSPASFPEVSTLSSVLDNQWHHLAGVFTGTQLQVYQDGALQSTLNQTALPVNNQRDAEIGRSWGGGSPTRYFHGLIDEVSYYDRALSSNEVAAIYAAGSAGKCPAAPVIQTGLRADYRFQNSLLSSVGNPPALSNLGSNVFVTATVDGTPQTVLAFGFNDGVLLQPGTSVIPSNVYSVVILAELEDVSYYRRLLGFAAIATDEGWYVHNGRLSYWPVVDGSSEAVVAGQFVQFALTRGADGTVRGYVGGVLQTEFLDADGSAGPGTGSLLRFFQDNTTDASAGQVARIRIYDLALTDAQVAALDRLPAAGPTLAIIRAGDTITVSWPTNYTGYRLRSAPSLTPPMSWDTVSNVSVSGSVFQATVGATNNGRFFQLVNP